MSYYKIISQLFQNLKALKINNSLFLLMFLLLYFLESNKIINFKKKNYSEKKNFMQYTLR